MLPPSRAGPSTAVRRGAARPGALAEVEVLVDEFPQAQALGEGGRQAVVGWPDGDTPGATGTLTYSMP